MMNGFDLVSGCQPTMRCCENSYHGRFDYISSDTQPSIRAYEMKITLVDLVNDVPERNGSS